MEARWCGGGAGELSRHHVVLARGEAASAGAGREPAGSGLDHTARWRTESKSALWLVHGLCSEQTTPEEGCAGQLAARSRHCGGGQRPGLEKQGSEETYRVQERAGPGPHGDAGLSPDQLLHSRAAQGRLGRASGRPGKAPPCCGVRRESRKVGRWGPLCLPGAEGTPLCLGSWRSLFTVVGSDGGRSQAGALGTEWKQKEQGASWSGREATENT